MRSMTGYGSGEGSVGGVTAAVELRSVNHRFLDVALKLPAAASSCEGLIREKLKDRLWRGRVTVSVQIALPADAAPVVMDEDRLRQGLAFLQRAASELEAITGRPQDLALTHLLQIPDLFRSEEVAPAEEEVRGALEAALDGALDALMTMKEREGAELVRDLETRIGTVRRHLAEVVRLAPEVATEAHERLRDRLAQLLSEQIDPQRLAQEAAILADRANINEECERLASHLDQCVAALAEGGQVAKRLNFLLQEMHREVNTMGSKTSLMSITQLVIAMKDEVESMREQIQNLE
jgi:uncharacterized protein (TIGR00255 family)